MGKLEALQWVHALLARDARLIQEQQELLLAALCDALLATSGSLVGVAWGPAVQGEGGGTRVLCGWLSCPPRKHPYCSFESCIR